jgi:hypothetical protein
MVCCSLVDRAATRQVVPGLAQPSPELQDLAGGGRAWQRLISVHAGVDAEFTASAAELGPPTLVAATAGISDALGLIAQADRHLSYGAVVQSTTQAAGPSEYG